MFNDQIFHNSKFIISIDNEIFKEKKQEILLKTEEIFKDILKNWQKTFVVFPFYYKEQTNYLSRRNYFQI